MLVTLDCIDPDYARPVIDSRVDISTPVAVHKVSGHFEGTNAKFNFYFPPQAKWDGRFFQFVYPMTDGEASEGRLRFGEDSGGYTVETVSTGGYRANAAAAKFSRYVAREYYKAPDRRIYGYIYGGSGGSYQTISAAENSVDVWDGAVPYVVGLETSIPNNFFVRAFARLVLRNKAEQIADAMRPGGSSDPFAGLDETERAVLREVSEMGVPLRGWDDASYLLGLQDAGGLLGFMANVREADPDYAEDFWSKPGYLGTETSPLGDLVRAAKIDMIAAVAATSDGKQFLLDVVPASESPTLLDFTVLDASGAALGAVKGSLDRATKRFTLADGNASAVVAALKPGARLRIDNLWSLAVTSLHRHQVPREPGFYPWDQFRNADGTPKYPQRPSEIGVQISRGVSGGGTHSGQIRLKMIAVANLLDVDAFPWHGDWYAKRVEAATGARYRDEFRLWLNDNADHLDGQVIASGAAGTKNVRLIAYDGIVQQAVRDVSRWVEKGVPPAPSSTYRVEQGQVIVPRDARFRGGVQPAVALTVDGESQVQSRVGQSVTLSGVIGISADTGPVLAVEWSQDGTDKFVPAQVPLPEAGRIILKQSFQYDAPGTYYPVLRMTTLRDGSASTTVRRLSNLARVRVVVR